MKKLLHGWSLILTLALLTGSSACSTDDAESPATVNVGQNTITFAALDKTPQTITVDASQEWTFEVSGDTKICEVTREEGSNVLTITPNVNYDNVAYTARIVISAGEGSTQTTQTITVSQAANSETYLTFMDSSLNTDNPIITVENNAEGGETVYPIRLATNNRLTVVYSENQEAPTTQSLEAESRAAIEGCDWITYEVSEEETVDGTITVLNLSCTFNEDTSKSRTAFLEIVSGEGTQNTVVKKRLGITQMADTPTIIVNAPEEGLVAAYDQSTPLTFSVAANVEFKAQWFLSQPSWATCKDITEEGSDSKVRNYSVEVQEWTGLSDREATLQFVAVDPEISLDVILKLTQTAAPQASITLNQTSVTFNNGEESSTKYIDAACSFSNMSITTRDLETEAEASWLTVTYDKELGSLVIKVDGTTEKTRSAAVTLYCGGNGNEASATLTVIQLGTEATLLLEPETVALDSKGTAQVVSVLTNQTDWSVVDATAEPNFTLSVDKEKKTITISATALDAGSREHVYTVKAGELEKQLTVSQRTAYKVGDPYMVNGKPVGIVYQVDEAGMHGKAFSLTTNNYWDKFFCYTELSGFKMDESSAPLSRTDGLANQTLIMGIPNWEETFQMTKWTVDLGKEQGVNWYIPAIDELKEVIEYMSNAKFEMKTHESSGMDIEMLPPIAEVEASWDVIRNLYKQYTTTENGYATEQYVVFQWGVYNDDYTLNHFIDGRRETVYDDSWNVVTYGDEAGEWWASSTVVVEQKNYRLYMAKFNYWEMSCGIMIDTYAEAAYIDVYNGGSIHPICQF